MVFTRNLECRETVNRIGNPLFGSLPFSVFPGLPPWYTDLPRREGYHRTLEETGDGNKEDHLTNTNLKTVGGPVSLHQDVRLGSGILWSPGTPVGRD